MIQIFLAEGNVEAKALDKLKQSALCKPETRGCGTATKAGRCCRSQIMLLKNFHCPAGYSLVLRLGIKSNLLLAKKIAIKIMRP